MKWVSFQTPKGETRVGLAETGKVIDFQLALKALEKEDLASQTKTLLDVVTGGKAILVLAKKTLDLFHQGKLSQTLLFEEEKIKILSPLPRPLSIRDAYAFRQHVEAGRKNRGLPMIPEYDHFPVFYFSNALAVTGQGDVPVHPKALEKLDYELEVAIVIGKEGRDIPADQADEYIFGYMIMNDWSGRALQMEEMKLNLGPAKGKDFAMSLGPYLVPRDSLKANRLPASTKGERYDLKMQAFVNGQKLSDGNLKNMTWTFAQILERVSMGVTLYPGEVIGSGTVGTGCLLELNGSGVTQNQWLKPGDEVILEIEELGSLKNTITTTAP
jgi:fumarylacetoacetate (FAA) hydrolase